MNIKNEKISDSRLKTDLFWDFNNDTFMIKKKKYNKNKHSKKKLKRMKSRLDRNFQIQNSHMQVVHFSNHSFPWISIYYFKILQKCFRKIKRQKNWKWSKTIFQRLLIFSKFFLKIF